MDSRQPQKNSQSALELACLQCSHNCRLLFFLHVAGHSPIRHSSGQAKSTRQLNAVTKYVCLSLILCMSKLALFSESRASTLYRKASLTLHSHYGNPIMLNISQKHAALSLRNLTLGNTNARAFNRALPLLKTLIACERCFRSSQRSAASARRPSQKPSTLLETLRCSNECCLKC